MKTLCSLLLLAVASSASAQTPRVLDLTAQQQTTADPVRFGTPLVMAWHMEDEPGAPLAQQQIIRYEVAIVRTNDLTGTTPGFTEWTKILLPGPVLTTEETIYRVPGLLPVGSHLFGVRACNGPASDDVSCGAVAPYRVQVTPPVPSAPRNFRRVPPGQPGNPGGVDERPITLTQAVDMVQCYSTLLLGRSLTQEQLLSLAARYRGPLTRPGVMSFLDEQALLLVP